ncbi:MAG: membrane protein insertase YidC [Alistipes sp.]
MNAANAAAVQQTQKVEKITVTNSPAGDSLRTAQAEQALERHLRSSLFQATKGTETFYTVENDLMKIRFSNKGGRVASVELKITKPTDSLWCCSPTRLRHSICRSSSNRDTTTPRYEQGITTSPRRGDRPDFRGRAGAKEFVLRLPVDSAAYGITFTSIRKDNYMIDFDVRFVGMQQILSPNQGDMEITWQNVGPQNEKGFENENRYTTIAYNYPGDDGIEELGISNETKEETINSKIKWVAFKQQFFSSILIAGDDFQNGSVKFTTFAPTAREIKTFHTQLAVPYTPQTDHYDFSFYFGPNKYSTLKKYDDLHLQKLVPLGGWIIGWVNRWLVIPTFDFLGKYISNYGLIILLLTIFIKIIISPLTYKSYLSTAKMRLLKPEMDKLNEKYPKQEDAMKKQQAMMALYKSAGVNPMGGCIPMLIQFPILIAMFRFFPASIELRGKSFLWADDLSSYDSILHLPFNIPFYGDHVSLFALLMAVSVFISSKINYAQTAGAGPQMAGMKFMMLYLMPLMLLFWFNNYSSGLSYYYLVSNIITIGQTYAFRYIVNEDKLHHRMKENAKKPRKLSKFQQRYEEMMKQREQMARKR